MFDPHKGKKKWRKIKNRVKVDKLFLFIILNSFLFILTYQYKN